MDKLNEIDTRDVEPMAQVLFEAEETATLRADATVPPPGQRGGPGQRPAARRRIFQSAEGDRTLNSRWTFASLTIDRVREGLLARRFSAGNWPPRRCASPRRRIPKTNAYLHFSPGARAGRRAPRGRENRARRRPRAAGRRAGGGQGRDRHQGRAHHLRLEAAGQLHPALRRHGGRAPGSRPAA